MTTLDWKEDGDGHWIASIDETRRARIDKTPTGYHARKTGEDPGGGNIATCETLEEAMSLFEPGGKTQFDQKVAREHAEMKRAHLHGAGRFQALPAGSSKPKTSRPDPTKPIPTSPSRGLSPETGIKGSTEMPVEHMPAAGGTVEPHPSQDKP